MSHDVYVCYDDEDKEIAEDVYSALKSRKLKCWMKSHDVRKDVVGEMMDAIDKSHVMVLIHSANTKFSDYVNTEVDMAFSKNKPIMVFRTDDSEISGGLEFFLSSQPKFNAYQDPDKEFKRLIDHTNDLVVDIKKGSIVNRIKEHKIPIIAAVAIILIAAVCIFVFSPFDNINTSEESAQLNASNYTLKVTQFNVEDVSKKNYGWNYSYSASGSISPMPAKGSGYVITADFYDKTGKLVNTTETSFDSLQIVDDGFLFGSTVSDTKDVARVEVQLLTAKNFVLAHDDAQVKNFK
jgi:hypothetical protein